MSVASATGTKTSKSAQNESLPSIRRPLRMQSTVLRTSSPQVAFEIYESCRSRKLVQDPSVMSQVLCENVRVEEMVCRDSTRYCIDCFHVKSWMFSVLDVLVIRTLFLSYNSSAFLFYSSIVFIRLLTYTIIVNDNSWLVNNFLSLLLGKIRHDDLMNSSNPHCTPTI